MLLKQNYEQRRTKKIKQSPVVPHEGFVVSDHFQRVLQLPTVTAVILEAGQIPEILTKIIGETKRATNLPAKIGSLL